MWRDFGTNWKCLRLDKIPQMKNHCNSRRAFILLLESCWDIFYLFLSNEDIGKIDSALTEKSLREIYFIQVSKFYSTTNIYSVCELEWIMKREIDLTVCRLDFNSEGIVISHLNLLTQSILTYFFIG